MGCGDPVPPPHTLAMLMLTLSLMHVLCTGSDGTGQSITTQLPGLVAQGYEVWSLVIPPQDRSSWLPNATVQLLGQLLAMWQARSGSGGAPGASSATGADNGVRGAAAGPGSTSQGITLVGESFGGCLAIRVAHRCASTTCKTLVTSPSPIKRRSQAAWGLATCIGHLPPPTVPALPTHVRCPICAAQHQADQHFAPAVRRPPHLLSRLVLVNAGTS